MSEKANTSENLVEEERERMLWLLSCLTEEQVSRYEMYKRSVFPKDKVQQIIENIAGSRVTENVVISVSAITKLFVRELVVCQFAKAFNIHTITIGCPNQVAHKCFFLVNALFLGIVWLIK